jgi:hypothetical protein
MAGTIRELFCCPTITVPGLCQWRAPVDTVIPVCKSSYGKQTFISLEASGPPTMTSTKSMNFSWAPSSPMEYANTMLVSAIPLSYLSEVI